MDRELDIINRLKTLGQEIERQDNRSTENPFYRITNNNKCFSFFESDVETELRVNDYRYNSHNINYVVANSNARKMNELQELLKELAEFI